MSINVIIVNWNTGHLLSECLRSLEGAHKIIPGFQEVALVDNNSTDDSMTRLANSDLPVRIIRNSVNRGFAAACNQGALGSKADFLLFLNPDTRCSVESISKPVEWLSRDENSQVGICGIQLVDDSGKVTQTCARFPTTGRFIAKIFGISRFLPNGPHFMEEWDHQSTREVPQIMGAFFLIRRNVFVSLGGFDERFFVYFEEVDLSFRARQIGWKSFYFAGARAYHKGQGSSEQIRSIRLFYSLRSRLLYGQKHFSGLSFAALLIATCLLEPCSRVLAAVAAREFSSIGEICEAFGRLWRWLPHLFRIRHKSSINMERDRLQDYE